MTDVFISYSRKDEDFVRQLTDSLEEKGRDVWVDFEDIPFASDWWQEIQTGIDNAYKAICVISPDSIGSQVVSMELNHIFNSGKELIPIVRRDVEIDKIPPKIASLNWIFFRQEDDYDTSFQELQATIDLNLSLYHEARQVLIRAREWEQKGRNPNFLLRGESIADMQAALQGAELIPLQIEYLQESIKRFQRQQFILRFAFGFWGGALGIAFFVFSVYRSNTFFSPSRVTLTIAYGEIFGLFIGLLALFAEKIPLQALTIDAIKLPAQLQFLSADNTVKNILIILLNMGISFVIGVIAWVVYQWMFLNIPFAITSSILWGALGLSFGFMFRRIVTNRVWISFLVTAVAIYTPIYLLNNFADITRDFDPEPLIYFQNTDQVFTVGIPMVILITIGVHFQKLTREFRGLYQKFKTMLSQ